MLEIFHIFSRAVGLVEVITLLQRTEIYRHEYFGYNHPMQMQMPMHFIKTFTKMQ